MMLNILASQEGFKKLKISDIGFVRAFCSITSVNPSVIFLEQRFKEYHGWIDRGDGTKSFVGGAALWVLKRYTRAVDRWKVTRLLIISA